MTPQTLAQAASKSLIVLLLFTVHLTSSALRCIDSPVKEVKVKPTIIKSEKFNVSLGSMKMTNQVMVNRSIVEVHKVFVHHTDKNDFLVKPAQVMEAASSNEEIQNNFIIQNFYSNEKAADMRERSETEVQQQFVADSIFSITDYSDKEVMNLFEQYHQ